MSQVSYVQRVIDRLVTRLPDNDRALLGLYAQLVLTKGTSTTDEDVHDAWAVWRNTTRPDHPDLIRWGKLSPENRNRDRKYRNIIRMVAVETAMESMELSDV
jgi:hypothetical protein